jgi:uncharacterized protein YceH (UPF0502 family)
MHAFAGLEEVQEALQRLIERGLVARLDRRPGQKEERYAQLLGDRTGDDAPERDRWAGRTASDDEAEPASFAPQADNVAADREPVRTLHERVAKLEREVAELRAGRDGSREAPSGDSVSVMSE